MNKRANKYASCSFSLIELMIVIGVMTVLVSMLIPTFSRALESARMVACGSQLRQIALGYRYYHDDHGMYPEPFFFLEDFRPVAPYIHSYRHQIFRCPSSRTEIPEYAGDWLVNTDYLYSPGNLRDHELASPENHGHGNNPYKFDPSNPSRQTTMIIDAKRKERLLYDRFFPAHLKYVNIVSVDKLNYEYQRGVSDLWVLDSNGRIIRSLAPYPAY